MNRINGKKLSEDFFFFYEEEKFDPEKMFKVLAGEVAGCIFRNIIPKKVCKRISKNFWKSDLLRKREDNVPAFYLGTYHYGKNLEKYIEEASENNKISSTLFNNTENILEDIIGALYSCLLNKNIFLRSAEYKGREAGRFLMRSWSNHGVYSLDPHEDLSQCYNVEQRGFEIQSTVDYEIVAVNICIENKEGGNLHYWDVQPDANSRKKLGLEQTGYPYPIDILSGYKKMIIPIRTGDIYCFNGKNIHAVDTLTELRGNRSTLSFLMGFKDKNTAIYWS